MNSASACPSADTPAGSTAISASWLFTYDGDGTRVEQIYATYDPDGVPTSGMTSYYFAGGAYEWRSDGKLEKYYTLGGQMAAKLECTWTLDENDEPVVACPDATGLDYFLTDQLGSVVAVLDAGGTLVGRQTYYPFGSVRPEAGPISQTDLGFTGQRNLDAQGNSFSLGLLDFHARFYETTLGRFIQPDTLVPDGDSQSLNRYSYVINSPINFIDPSGNMPSQGCGEGRSACANTSNDEIIKDIFNWNLVGSWSSSEIDATFLAGYRIQKTVDQITGGNGLDWMHKYLGGTNIAHSDNAPSWASWVPKYRDMTNPAVITSTGTNTIYLQDNWLSQDGGSRWLTHEMGHIWDINTSPIIPFYGGVGDQLNSAMGGNQIINPCRFCDNTGPGNGNKNPFNIGSYGNNSTADYLAESFALSIYPDKNDPVPTPAQVWLQDEIWNEAYFLNTDSSTWSL